MSFAAAVANRLYMAGALASRRRFESATRDPVTAQREVLRRILRAGAPSDFGARHGFAGIGSVDDYRRAVPITTYDALEPEVLRAAEGARNVLTGQPVICFEPSGGSSGANKLVPYTQGLLREFAAATQPWVYDLLARRPALRNGRAYWAVTPPARTARRTAGDIPIGMEHDTDYFPAIARLLLDRVVGTPRALSQAGDVDTWRYLTLRTLLGMHDLAFISVWSPTFLTLLATALDEQFERLVHDLATGTFSVPMDDALRATLGQALPARPRRAAELRRRFGRRPPDDLGAVWPMLAVISCWTHAHAARALPPLRARFPRVELQGKGLLATEGVVSIPLCDASGPVAAVTSHFLEFLPERGGDALGAHELASGATYDVLLTTAGGLYRYRLHDLVRVDGWYHRTPILTFVGRSDHTSDLSGEKLTSAFAEWVLQDAAAHTGIHVPFAMLLPVTQGRPRYDLWLECEEHEVERFTLAVEARLGESHHYALCRSLGQLDGLRAVPVRDGARAYERACVQRGQRLSAIKPAALATGLDLAGAA